MSSQDPQAVNTSRAASLLRSGSGTKIQWHNYKKVEHTDGVGGWVGQKFTGEDVFFSQLSFLVFFKLYNYLLLCAFLKRWFVSLFNLALSWGLNVSEVVVVALACIKRRKKKNKKKKNLKCWWKRKHFFETSASKLQHGQMAFTESSFRKEWGTAPRAAIPLVTFIVTNYTTKTSGREGIIALGLVILLLQGNVQAIGCFSIPASASVGVCGTY